MPTSYASPQPPPMTLANHNHRGPPPWETSSGRSASRPSSFSSTSFATSSDTKRVVFVSVRVIQIGNISERDQTFEARMDVFVEWNDPQSKKLSAVELEKIATTCIREKKAGHWWEVRSSSRERLLARPRLLTPPPARHPLLVCQQLLAGEEDLPHPPAAE